MAEEKNGLLSYEERQVVWMRLFEKKTEEEIAEILQIPCIRVQQLFDEANRKLCSPMRILMYPFACDGEDGKT